MDEGKGMGGFAAVLGGFLVLILLVTLVTVAIDEDEQDPCKDIGGSSSDASGGVPDGDFSKPMKEGTHQESSGYRSPDRPDHRGTDLAADMHTPIYAYADGVVVNAGPSNDGPQGFGNWVVIDHEGDDGKFSTVYGHMPLGDIKVKPGDKVKAGQHIAGVGSEGGSSGPHLHFEVWPGGRDGGKDTDPVPWIDKATNPGEGGGEVKKNDDAPEAGKDKVSEDNRDAGGGDTGGGVLVVGDSISEGSRGELEKAIPGVEVNARVSRPFDEGAGIIRRDIDSLPGTLVIALGTNGGVSAGDYKALVDEVGEKAPDTKVVGVNTYADREWTDATNAAIESAGVPVADWHGAVEADSGLLGGDGLHPSPSGHTKFAELVAAETGGGGGKSGGKEKPADTRDLSEVPSDKIASEEHLMTDSVRIARAVASKFPDLKEIGGWRPVDAYPDHPSGRAVDIMIPDYDSDKGKKLGDEIKDYIFRNKADFNVEYLIWRQQYIPADGEPNQMEDRGDPTQNHFDHVHVTVREPGGGPYNGGKLGPAPEGGGPGAGSSSGECGGPVGEHGRALADGEIPEELKKPIALGGQVCREVDSPLLAGLLYHESAGFNPQALSHAGAQGYPQAMPDTWASSGAETDKETGEVTGPPGSGSPSDPMDGAMFAARYLCSIAENQRPLIESGAIKGDPEALMLAGYNSGEGNVQNYGGVPPFAETQKYVVIVPKEAERFADAGKE